MSGVSSHGIRLLEVEVPANEADGDGLMTPTKAGTKVMMLDHDDRRASLEYSPGPNTSSPGDKLDPPVPRTQHLGSSEAILLNTVMEDQYNILSERDKELELFRLDEEEEGHIIGRNRGDEEARSLSAGRFSMGRNASPNLTGRSTDDGTSDLELGPGALPSPRTQHSGDAAPKLLGTVAGVFLPCLQNILGVIFFIRLSWLVGQAGVWQAVSIVVMCCTCTFITSLSLSAIATNGKVRGGGPYFLIGRALGPEVGVSIGCCFYLGTSVAASMYILGAVETIFDAVPSLKIFTKGTDDIIAIADFQIYGIIITIFLLCVVMLGTKMVSRVGPLFLVPVILSVILIYVGMFAAPSSSAPDGVTGLDSSTFRDNWSSAYVRTDRTGKPQAGGSESWSYQALVALFFPSVTGIMAGSNRSGALKDAQQSIPKGTIAAQVTTSAIYVASIFMFGSVAVRETLLSERLLTTRLAWPAAEVASVGIILSTLGAGLQSLSGAPKLLQAMANDDVIPFLKPLKSPDGTEGRKCLLVTAAITGGCVLIGNLDLITPVITMFFLMCYFGVNFSCFLLDIMDSPNWRPRWKFYHWTLAGLGGGLCLAIMFLISWIFSVVAIAVAFIIYWYVSVYGKEENWGDGLKSLRYRLALRAMLKLGEHQIHPKNWHPSPVVLCKPWGLLPDSTPCHPKLLAFASYFKEKGTGLCFVASIMEGEYADRANDAYLAKKRLIKHINDEQFEAFSEVVVAKSVPAGFRAVMQLAGLGNLRPNLVVMRWPERWRDTEKHKRSIPNGFVAMTNDCYVAGKALVLVKGIDNFPGRWERQSGTIDLYWIVRDGGIMLLFATLLRKAPAWERCKVRVFCIAEDDEHVIPLKNDVEKFLYELRMSAKVEVLLFRDGEKCPCCGEVNKDSAEKFAKARRRIAERWSAVDTLKANLEVAARDHNLELDEEEEANVLKGTPVAAGPGGKDMPGESLRFRSIKNMQKILNGDGGVGGRNKGRSVDVTDDELGRQKRIDKYLSTSVKLNGTIRTHSRDASLVLVSMPPPPRNDHAYNYMEYLETLLEDLPRTIIVRGYRRDVVTIYT
mmetsp:Transcript_69726/g.220759  ORF Transcript_69726/g.220759 Transcript_69726/m.220759 type:complete len:1075 (+) Transcript_69726:77-3301(+)